MINRFVLNEVSYFGPGAREVLPQEINRLGLHKAFVSTDKDLLKFGVADKVLKVLEKAGIPYEIFSEIKPNPTVANVKAGVEAFARSGADFILAIGGGSSIDTSKAIGIITNNPEFSDVVSLEGVAPTKKKSVPIIALPTTAGTAAEVTINYVITDEENHKKMVCVDVNEANMFTTTVSTKILTDFFNCKLDGVLKVNNTRLLAYLMMQLSCYNYIVYEWQSVIANNKLILKKIKGEPLTRTDLSSATDQAKNIYPKGYEIIDKYIKQLQKG